jgi:hypothetical protein
MGRTNLFIYFSFWQFWKRVETDEHILRQVKKLAASAKRSNGRRDRQSLAARKRRGCC